MNLKLAWKSVPYLPFVIKANDFTAKKQLSILNKNIIYVAKHGMYAWSFSIGRIDEDGAIITTKTYNENLENYEVYAFVYDLAHKEDAGLVLHNTVPPDLFPLKSIDIQQISWQVQQFPFVIRLNNWDARKELGKQKAKAIFIHKPTKTTWSIELVTLEQNGDMSTEYVLNKKNNLTTHQVKELATKYATEKNIGIILDWVIPDNLLFEFTDDSVVESSLKLSLELPGGETADDYTESMNPAPEETEQYNEDYKKEENNPLQNRYEPQNEEKFFEKGLHQTVNTPNTERPLTPYGSLKLSSEPTEKEKEAGNYKKYHVRKDGLDISIENRKGSVRSGTSSEGKKWSNTMKNSYGYIKGTVGKDKDSLDVFIANEYKEGQPVFIVNQLKKGGSFDEHKILLGFTTKYNAEKAYVANYEKGWDQYKDIVEMPMKLFKTWMVDKKLTQQPVPEDLQFKKLKASIKQPYEMTKKEYIQSQNPDNIYTTIEHYIMKAVTDLFIETGMSKLSPDSSEYQEVVNRVLQLGSPNIRPDDFIFLEQLASNFMSVLTKTYTEKIPFQKYKTEDTYKFLNKYIDMDSAINTALDEFKNDYGKEIAEHRNSVVNALRNNIQVSPTVLKDYPELININKKASFGFTETDPHDRSYATMEGEADIPINELSVIFQNSLDIFDKDYEKFTIVKGVRPNFDTSMSTKYILYGVDPDGFSHILKETYYGEKSILSALYNKYYVQSDLATDASLKVSYNTPADPEDLLHQGKGGKPFIYSRTYKKLYVGPTGQNHAFLFEDIEQSHTSPEFTEKMVDRLLSIIGKSITEDKQIEKIFYIGRISDKGDLVAFWVPEENSFDDDIVNCTWEMQQKGYVTKDCKLKFAYDTEYYPIDFNLHEASIKKLAELPTSAEILQLYNKYSKGYDYTKEVFSLRDKLVEGLQKVYEHTTQYYLAIKNKDIREVEDYQKVMDDFAAKGGDEGYISAGVKLDLITKAIDILHTANDAKSCMTAVDYALSIVHDSGPLILTMLVKDPINYKRTEELIAVLDQLRYQGELKSAKSSVASVRRTDRIFVCFWLPKEVEDRFSHILGLEEELHMTLAYVPTGKLTEEKKQEILKNLSKVAQEYPKVKCTFTGIGAFKSPEKPIVALINVKDGAELHTNIINSLVKAVGEWDKKYDFVPHVTLQTNTNGRSKLKNLKRFSWTAHTMGVRFNDTENYLIDLNTGRIRKTLSKQAWQFSPIDSRDFVGRLVKYVNIETKTEDYAVITKIQKQDFATFLLYGLWSGTPNSAVTAYNNWKAKRRMLNWQPQFYIYNTNDANIKLTILSDLNKQAWDNSNDPRSCIGWLVKNTYWLDGHKSSEYGVVRSAGTGINNDKPYIVATWETNEAFALQEFNKYQKNPDLPYVTAVSYKPDLVEKIKYIGLEKKAQNSVLQQLREGKGYPFIYYSDKDYMIVGNPNDPHRTFTIEDLEGQEPRGRIAPGGNFVAFWYPATLPRDTSEVLYCLMKLSQKQAITNNVTIYFVDDENAYTKQQLQSVTSALKIAWNQYLGDEYPTEALLNETFTDNNQPDEYIYFVKSYTINEKLPGKSVLVVKYHDVNGSQSFSIYWRDFKKEYRQIENTKDSHIITATPETYTSGSDVDQPVFNNSIDQFHQEDHRDINNGRDGLWGETDYTTGFPNPSNENVVQKLDQEYPEALLADSALKLSWKIHTPFIGMHIKSKRNIYVTQHKIPIGEIGYVTKVTTAEVVVSFDGFKIIIPTSIFFETVEEINDIESSLKLSSDDPAFDDYSQDRGKKLLYYDDMGGNDALEGHQSYDTDLRLPDTEKDEKELDSMDWTGRENMVPAFGI